MLAVYGRGAANIDANITGALGPIGFATERSVSDARTASGDLFFEPTLRWHDGIHSYLVHGLVTPRSAPTTRSRLVSLGLGHVSVDAGGSYTCFNPATGWEASAVAGLTYNFTNPSLDYQNGIDAHLDWGISRIHVEAGACRAGRLCVPAAAGDSGSGATLGDFKSRVFAVGPQVGFLFRFATCRAI